MFELEHSMSKSKSSDCVPSNFTAAIDGQIYVDFVSKLLSRYLEGGRSTWIHQNDRQRSWFQQDNAPIYCASDVSGC